MRENYFLVATIYGDFVGGLVETPYIHMYEQGSKKALLTKISISSPNWPYLRISISWVLPIWQ